MSDHENVQLVGGPLDGEVVSVPCHIPVWRTASDMVLRDVSPASVGRLFESVMDYSRVVDYTRRVWVETGGDLSCRIEFFGLSTITDAECLMHLLSRPPRRPAAPPDRTA